MSMPPKRELMIAHRICCCCLVLLLTLAVNGYTFPTDTELSGAIAEYLQNLPPQVGQLDEDLPTFPTRDLCLTAIYDRDAAKPLWVDNQGPIEKATIILNTLTHCYKDGLDPKEYDVERLLQLWSAKDVDDLVELDASLSYSLLKYMHDISYGRLKPSVSDPILFAEAGEKRFNPVTAAKRALAASDLRLFLAGLPPQHYHYRGLKTGLAHYHNIAIKGGWTRVPPGPNLRPGDYDPRISAVRKRLKVTDPLLGSISESADNVYDPMLKKAVLAFQRRHGLTVDGVVGKNTISALNIPIAEKIDSIRINMARWRWKAHDLGEKYVLVNIAAFTLKTFMGEEIVLDMPVIVGKDQHQTPVFSERVRYMDVNPFWNIPTSIAQNEDLPGLRKNSNYLVNRHIRLFSSWQADAVELDSSSINWHTISKAQMAGYRLRQDPGPWNALGKIKFMFPNRYSVYMHDTPEHNLFEHTKRNFSHGCIRISDGLGLALFLLQDQQGDWSAAEFAEIYQQEQRKVIHLSTPVPVHISYLTSWVDENGTIHFSRDIYNRDAKLCSALSYKEKNEKR